MKLALDATYSVGSALSGVGVYSRELLTALAALHPDTLQFHCYRPHRFVRGLRTARAANVWPVPLFDAARLFSCDLFHGLNQRLPHWRARRMVCTFHDLFVMSAAYSTDEFRERFTAQAREAAARADLIICVSQFTASQVSSLLNVETSRLRVVHHGVRPMHMPQSGERKPWLLHVGAVQTRKNLLRLIEAFERSTSAPWRLVLAGGDGFEAAAIHARAASSSARDRIDFLGWVDDARLASLYAECAALVFPSLDEGFGIPVLEAMAAALPVVAGNRSALPEVCGDAALLVDPSSTDDLAGAIAQLVSKPELRDALRLRGLARVAGRTWARAADETWAVYRELA